MEVINYEEDHPALQQWYVHQHDGGKDEGGRQKIGYDCTIAAYALSAASEVTADADCILIGPQVKHKLGEVQAACPGIPAAPIDMKDYGMMNGVAVLKAARKMMGEEV